MGKKLNIAGIENELQGASVFFPSTPPATIPAVKVPPVKHHSPVSAPVAAPTTPVQPVLNTTSEPIPEKTPFSPKAKADASVLARKQDSAHASKRDSMLAKITKAIRGVGKEVSYTRLTREEKKQILETVYSFRSEGIKLSENELMRIALHVLLEDYRSNKTDSLLHRLLHQ